jgi:TPP-dependent pyruvate/acetoin dehydrogenase alpha subunit
MPEEIPQEVIKNFSCYTPYKAPEDLPLEKQLDMFYRMNLIREFDTRVVDLWMENKIYGIAHSYVGSEAIAVGACAVLEPKDYIVSTHRGHGHCIAKGSDVKKMMAELYGKYEGYNHGKGGSMHIADVENGMLGAQGIVGGGIPFALGAALSSKVLGNGRVAIGFHGDGGSNQGVWHEAMNMASAYKLPVIYICENNQYAISTPLQNVTGQQDLYLRAKGYAIPGALVDGYNVFAMYEAVKEAVERARAGKGPSFIEARTIRFLGHFVADDQWYRDLESVKPYWSLEPLRRMRSYFLDNKLVAEDELKSIEEKAVKRVEEAINYASNECSEPPKEKLYEDVYAGGEIIK